MIHQLIILFFLSMDSTIPEENIGQAIDACAESTIPLPVCLSIAYHESRFNPEAVGPVLKSGRRALGMMQVIPTFHSMQEPVDIHSFYGSVLYGEAAFSYWYKRSNQRIEKALCHYAAGNKCHQPYADKILTTSYNLILDIF